MKQYLILFALLAGMSAKSQCPCSGGDSTMLYPGDTLIFHEFVMNANFTGWVDSAKVIDHVYFPADSAAGLENFYWLTVKMIQVRHLFPLVVTFTNGEALWGKSLKFDSIRSKINSCDTCYLLTTQ